MKRGTASRVILGKNTIAEMPGGVFVGTDVILGKKDGLTNDFNGLVLSNTVMLGKKVSHAAIISVIVHGADRIVLPDAIAGSLQYVKAFGGTEQNGTPTPDTPVDIVSNNGVLKARHQSGLPLGYTALEYLQSDGASYLIVPYRVNNKTVFYCRYNEIQRGPQVASAVFGVTSVPNVSQANYGILRLLNGTATFNRMGWGDTTSGSIIDVDAPQDSNTWYEVLYDQNKLYQDNVLYATSTTPNNTEWVANHDLGIFARNSSSVTMPAIVKISSVWAKEDDEYKLNLVPVKRNSDNVLGMYDLVSGQFLTNLGTGDFVAGDPVSDPVEIYTDGTVETIQATGKNLFDKNNITPGYYYTDTGAYTTTAEAGLSDWVAISPNTTYTITTELASGSVFGANRRVNYFDSNKNWLSQDVYQIQNNTKVFSITTPSNAKYLRISYPFSGAYALDNNAVQIELGSTATEYAPYYNGGTATAEMLLKVGNYQDVQSILDGVVTRNVGVAVLDGTEDWAFRNQSLSLFYGTIADTYFNDSQANHLALSTHFLGVEVNNTNMPDNSCKCASLSGTNKLQLFVKSTNFASPEDLKSWLTGQYAAGTPVIVVYPLAEPTTESVAGQTLQVTDGDNVLEITQASLTGLELEAQYNTLVQLTVQEVESANLDNDVTVTIL